MFYQHIISVVYYPRKNFLSTIIRFLCSINHRPNFQPMMNLSLAAFSSVEVISAFSIDFYIRRKYLTQLSTALNLIRSSITRLQLYVCQCLCLLICTAAIVRKSWIKSRLLRLSLFLHVQPIVFILKVQYQTISSPLTISNLHWWIFFSNIPSKSKTRLLWIVLVTDRKKWESQETIQINEGLILYFQLITSFHSSI